MKAVKAGAQLHVSWPSGAAPVTGISLHCQNVHGKTGPCRAVGREALEGYQYVFSFAAILLLLVCHLGPQLSQSLRQRLHCKTQN